MRNIAVIFLAILSILLANCANQQANAEKEIEVPKKTLTQKSQIMINIVPD